MALVNGYIEELKFKD